jgi:polyisoprenoid-binding protein YceI
MSTQLVPQIMELQPGDWDIDPAHTVVRFSVRHMTVARVSGRFPQVSGSLVVPEDEVQPTVSAVIGVGSVQSGHPKRDELIRSAEFLDAEQYPQITFDSTGFTATGNGRYQVSGELTIKRVTRPVLLDAELGGVVTHRGAQRAGFSAATTVDRKDFGVMWNGLLDSGGAIVSDKVKIELEVELVYRAG